jgi:hypothetical protein
VVVLNGNVLRATPDKCLTTVASPVRASLSGHVRPSAPERPIEPSLTFGRL